VPARKPKEPTEIPPLKEQQDYEYLASLTPKQRKLYEIRKKAKIAQHENRKAVMEEEKKKYEGAKNYERNKREEYWKKKNEKKDEDEDEEEEEEDKKEDVKNNEKKEEKEDPEKKKLMNTTAEEAQWEDKKNKKRKRRRKNENFGWHRYSNEAQNKAFQKKTRREQIRYRIVSKRKRNKRRKFLS